MTTLEQPSDLDQAVFDTIRWFDLFGMPVTTVQIWRSLIISHDGTGVRWHGHHVPRLAAVRDVLMGSRLLLGATVSWCGYWTLVTSAGYSQREVKSYVRAWLLRHAEGQRKWQLTRWVVRWLWLVPFVRMIAGSGSLALFNTRQASDLDLFVVVRRKRIWTARLGLLLVTQLLGRRRKHWDELAPDKVCLNHYVTDHALVMNGAIHNVYTAWLYHNAVPLAGLGVYREWMAANESWMRRWLMYPAKEVMPSRLFVSVSTVTGWCKDFVERVLLELPGDFIEWIAERVQRRAVARHTRPGQVGRVVVSADELAFHPDTKVPALIARFDQEVGQGQLL